MPRPTVFPVGAGQIGLWSARRVGRGTCDQSRIRHVPRCRRNGRGAGGQSPHRFARRVPSPYVPARVACVATCSLRPKKRGHAHVLVINELIALDVPVPSSNSCRATEHRDMSRTLQNPAASGGIPTVNSGESKHPADTATTAGISTWQGLTAYAAPRQTLSGGCSSQTRGESRPSCRSRIPSVEPILTHPRGGAGERAMSWTRPVDRRRRGA